VKVKAGNTTFVLGGARSGKSSFAQKLAEANTGELIYIATAQAFDDEMTDRIARHKADRGPRWQTVECPIDLAQAIAANDGVGKVILIDCLTLWLTNLMLGDHDVQAATKGLIDTMASSAGQIILVSNEVGQGIVPDNALARRFRDEAGWLNQSMAAATNDVWFVIAGLPQQLKGQS
jgi:adenosylcobinamide kinase / adenosylcobinamide-phosphate guanylyltransferase